VTTALARKELLQDSTIVESSAKSIPAKEIFRECCWARATLVEACEIDLQTAVDELQEYDEKSGLVASIRQDHVQAYLAEAFRKVPRAGELEDAISELADALEAPRPRSGVAPSTLMAADYLLREKDMKRLRAWLASHSAAERIAIRKHLRAKK
jgi:hypothetical protein